MNRTGFENKIQASIITKDANLFFLFLLTIKRAYIDDRSNSLSIDRYCAVIGNKFLQPTRFAVLDALKALCRSMG